MLLYHAVYDGACAIVQPWGALSLSYNLRKQSFLEVTFLIKVQFFKIH